MGNGEQYIWKPPEEDDIITLHPPPLRGENGQGHPSPPTAKEVVHVCVCVCGGGGSWQEGGTPPRGSGRTTGRRRDAHVSDLFLLCLLSGVHI